MAAAELQRKLHLVRGTTGRDKDPQRRSQISALIRMNVGYGGAMPQAIALVPHAFCA